MQWPKPGPESEARRARAESLIESSGDGRAIRHLGLLRRDPRMWSARLLEGARNSLILKVALGTFLGVIAADAVRGMLQGDSLQSLVDQVDQAISDAGGLEGLETLAAGETQGQRMNTVEAEPMSGDASEADSDASWDEVGDEDLTDGLELPF